MDNWSEGCEQAEGGQGNGLYGYIIFTVDSELDVGRECEDAQGEDLRCCLCCDAVPGTSVFSAVKMDAPDTSCCHTVVVQ